MKKTQAVQDPIFLLYSLPGLEMAAQQIVDQMNQIRRSVGQEEIYYLGRERIKRQISEEGKLAIAAGQKRRWSKNGDSNGTAVDEKPAQLAAAPEIPPTVRLSSDGAVGTTLGEEVILERNASTDELVEFAKSSGRLFRTAEFKDAFPNTHCRAVGILVKSGRFKSVSPGVYKLHGK